MSTAYDYVVVGAGSAGCALASRLSEHGASVALVEAGGPAPASSRIPLAAPDMFGASCDWSRTTTPQPGLNGRTVTWPAGRMVGGSSAMNFMMWVPGAAQDFDDWAAVAGELWSWPHVEPFLRATEGWTGTVPRPPLSDEGPHRISPPQDPDPSTAAFLTACQEVGMPSGNAGMGSRDTTGYGLTPLTQYGGRRWSAADAYLTPPPANLTLITDAEVDRLIFATGTMRAVGVELGDGHSVHARREVVLCAGPVGSPRLLLRSGIGDPAPLRAAGITPQFPLPGVGQNLYDHLILDLVVESTAPTRFSALASAEANADAVKLFASGTGPYTSNIAEAVTYLRSERSSGPPDIELIWSPMAFGPGGFTTGYTIGVVLLRPRSRGSLTLTEIDPAYLTDDTDVAALTAGIDAAERLLSTPALQRITSAPTEPPWGRDPTARANYARAHADTVFHPVGTCRLGQAADSKAVVDPHLRVHGIHGLRVADTSIIPTPPRAHTHALAAMIGERAASLIYQGTPSRRTQHTALY